MKRIFYFMIILMFLSAFSCTGVQVKATSDALITIDMTVAELYENVGEPSAIFTSRQSDGTEYYVYPDKNIRVKVINNKVYGVEKNTP